MTLKGSFKNAKEMRRYSAGDVVFAEGDEGAEMFCVMSGSVELRHGSDTVNRIAAGETFGEMAIIDHAPRSLSAVATEPTELAVIDQRSFLFLVHETPMFAIDVMRSLAHRIREHDAGR
jgi:CRP/FNR family transcriptional regulator, cyclic AMP receptor protein